MLAGRIQSTGGWPISPRSKSPFLRSGGAAAATNARHPTAINAAWPYLMNPSQAISRGKLYLEA
jgi:hypothetical protein